MRYSFIAPILGAALILSGCSEQAVAPVSDSGTMGVDGVAFANGATMIPVSFVTQFSAFLGGEFSPNGNSGRSHDLIGLAFSVQEGDLAGTMETWLSQNSASPQTASQGTNGIFSTSRAVSTEFDVCMPALGLCGTFSGAAGPGKVYPQPRGIDAKNVAFGGGDFEGMKLQGEVFDCAGPQGNRGCFTGHLLIPANN